jgi:hypothetical protein
MIGHKLLHNATLMNVNVLDAQHFIGESWRCVTHITVVSCCQKCGFSLIQTNDGEEAIELGKAGHDSGQLKTGVSI